GEAVLRGGRGAGRPVPCGHRREQVIEPLKVAIKRNNEKPITCDARELKLVLTKKGDAWLKSNDPIAPRLREGNAEVLDEHRHPKGFEHMDVVGLPLNFVVLIYRRKTLVVIPKQSVPIVVAAAIKKRELAELRELITPSSFAKCKGGGSWVKWLKTLMGRLSAIKSNVQSDETSKTIARLEQNCKQIEFGNEDCEFVKKLCHGMSTPYESEAALAEKARSC
ncbi:TPA: hypothetical protein N0F65_001465, partial [Lagenidium giganteum]